MTTLQEYQKLKDTRHALEIEIEKVKAQAEVYKQSIAQSLAEVGVSSIEELNAKYLELTEKLQSEMSLLASENAKAQEQLAKLRGCN